MSKAIPDRWENYRPLGEQIKGTRFIPFKVPLRKHVSDTVERGKRLDDRILLQKIPNLGLIIDLTNTTRYYDPQVFEKEGIEYKKIMIPGRETPPKENTKYFVKIVKEFEIKNKNNGKLIGVHCTHGVNRTGYLICYYMISQMAMKAKEAIDTFAEGRGYKIERTNYVADLHRLKLAEKRNGNCRNQHEKYQGDWNRGVSRSSDNTAYSRSLHSSNSCRDHKRPSYHNHAEERSNYNNCAPAERYADHHCTMSDRPSRLRLDYYSTRPTP